MSEALLVRETEGGENEGRGGGGVAAAAATVSLVSRLLLAKRSGGSAEWERSREGRQGRERSVVHPQKLWERRTRCESVDLGAGHRTPHPWIISSE